MINVVLNELSLVAQCGNSFQGRAALDILFETLEQIEPLNQAGQATYWKHPEIMNDRLVGEESLWDTVHGQPPSTRRTWFLRFFKDRAQSFYYELQRCPNHVCSRVGNRAENSALAMACYVNGLLVSFTNAPDYSSHVVQANFSPDGASPPLSFNLDNAIVAQHTRNVVPRYLAHEKHTTPWAGASFMDLNDLDGQLALFASIVHSPTRRYAKFSGKYYAFLSDGDIPARTWHGFIVEGYEVPSEIRQQLDE